MEKNNLKDQIDDYLRYSQVERGLSDNTINAYRQDLEEFRTFVENEGMASWPTEASDVDAFLARQRDLNKATSSISRLISSMRKFYQWLARQNIQKLNPMLEIDLPKKERRLPTALSQAEMNRLLEQPNTKRKLGIRDRAILETLYATGMRVSELINLELQDLHDDLGLVRVLGKGEKERLIPISPVALDWIKKYGVRYFSELTNMACLTEEVGELARVIARKYGDQSFKTGEKENLEEEMADVLWVLICLANQTGVNLTKALEQSFAKKTNRDKDRHINNQKLK